MHAILVHVVHGLRGASLAALLYSPVVHSQEAAAPDVQAQLKDLQRQLAEQRLLIEAMANELETRRGPLRYGAALSPDELDRKRGAGNRRDAILDGMGAAAAADVAEGSVAEGNVAKANGSDPISAEKVASTRDAPGPASASASALGPTVRAARSSSAPADTPGTPSVSYATAAVKSAPPASAQAGPVGRPPASRGRPPEVAPLFEQPGVLTPKGKFVFEPALQFGYSSSNRVALVGYTIIPALLIGLVDVREVKRNTTTAILSGRLGLTNRLEIDAKLPYVYRSDSTVSREIFTGTAVENVFSTSGKGVGDAELGVRYQLNNGGPDSAFYVGSLRIKSRTGRDPFSVITDCTQRCIGPNASGTGLPLDLPTGSGFYSIQPGLTWLFPSDPAVFFGSISYLHNLKRSNVSRTVLGGEREFLGEVKPGDIVGFNFGMGLGLNEKASFSLGYDHSSIGRTKQNGIPVPGAVRTQLGTLLLGFSYRINARRSFNVAVGAGLTRDTPDITLTVRMPTTF